MPRKYKIRVDSVDETGKRYGMLLVIERDYERKFNNPRGTYWKCLCDCGSYCLARGGALREGRRKSCGCLRERTIENTGINRLISMYKYKGYKAHRFFNLSREDFYKLIKGNCFYCGIEPKQVLKRHKTELPQIIYNGIDRIDPKKCYSPDNCVSCCKYCNWAKSDLTMDEFKARIERIYRCLLKDG
jgi:hypothetical protein